MKNKIVNFYNRHRDNIVGHFALVLLLFVLALFIENTNHNFYFVILHMFMVIVVINCSHVFISQNKMLYYKTSLGTTRKQMSDELFLITFKSLSLLTFLVCLFTIFVFLYNGQFINADFTGQTFLQLLLGYIFFIYLAFVLGRTKLSPMVFFAIFIAILLGYSIYLVRWQRNLFYVNLGFIVANVSLYIIHKLIFDRDLQIKM